METLRVILAIAIIKNYSILQMDVKGAYLNGTLKEKVYMTQPEGHNDGTGRVCLLVKTLYGLKPSGREWNIELDNKLKKYGFKQLKSNPCAYIRRNGEDVAILTIWVDDLMLFASSEQILKSVKIQLSTEWEITDLGEPAKIVGIEITKMRDGIRISQEKYIDSILKRQGMEGANPVLTPMDTNDKVGPNPDGNEGNCSNSYTQLLGENMFHGYANAAYTNTDDFKLTSGYVFLMRGGAVTWRSKKQTMIALSSTEAKYVALCKAGREACWLRNLMEELGEPQLSPTLIKGDNDGSIAMARNLQFHKRLKHIAMRWHWIRDKVQESAIAIDSCRDPEQTADILTKPLPRPKHRKHLNEMGLVAT
jgi:hypothetical protein